MKNLCKGLLIAFVATGLGVIAVPKASADTIITTTTSTMPMIDFSSPVVLTQPSLIDTSTLMPTTVITQPAVIQTQPVIQTTPVFETAPIVDTVPLVERNPHLLHVGLGDLFNFSLF